MDDCTGRRPADASERLAARAPPADAVARAGLGVTLLLAGAHKLLAPDAWIVYVTDWLAPWLVVSPVAFMLANGVVEVAFGLVLLADRYTWLVAGVTALSLVATAGYLGLAAHTSGGQFLDVAVRDVGLAVLAIVVTLEALGAGERPMG